MSLLSVKIFVSSPGDVAQERFLTEKVLTRLQNVYRHVCKLEPIFWEHEPLTADRSFQEGLVSPRETDIVICILWSRLGTRLPKHVTGGADLTGTEFEVQQAIQGREEKGIPDLLVYRKETRAFADLSDLARSTEAIEQKKALEAFVNKWFKNEAGALVAAFHPFERADQFEEHVELHLRKLIDRRLAAAGISPDAVGPTPTWLEGSPFRGLQQFDFEHEPVFFGRTKAIGEVVDRLKRQAEAGRAFLLVLGMSGCGKSSLIRAGVLPALSRPGVIEGVGLCRRAILRPGHGDVFEALAAALLQDGALPELAHDGTTAAQLARSLRNNPAGAAMLLKGAISQAAAGLKPAEEGARQPQARLLFLVDQLEELFTNDKMTADDRGRFACLLTSLACEQLSQTWVIATLRSDFYAPLAQVPELAALKEGLGQYDLLFPNPAEIGLLVREPASAAGLRFEQRPAGERLDDVLQDVVSRDASLLPLLEFTLNELYEQQAKRQTDRGRLNFADYQAIGGVEGALAQRAESTFMGLAEEVRAELPAVFRRLVTIGTLSDETPTSQQAPLARFAASPPRVQFVQAFIAARLFVSDHADDGSAVVRITHESLLGRWERLQRWLAGDRELLRVKARVERAAARWLQEGRRADLLLTAGKPLDEAEQLQASGFELDPEVHEMIAASRKRALRNRRLRQAAVAALAVLTLAASGLAVLAQIQGSRAVAARQATEQANQQLQETNVDLDAAKNLAETKTREAVDALKTTNRQLALSYIDRAGDELERGDRLRGFAILGQAYRVTSETPDLRPSVRALLGAWDGALPRTLRHGGWVNAVVFSPDGTKLATASDNNTARLWDAATGQSLGEPMKHDNEVEAVAFSPDGTKLATGSGGVLGTKSLARLWDATTGKPLGPPMAHESEIDAVVFSPDGRKLIVRGGATVRLWDAATLKPLGGPLKPGGNVYAMALSADGTKIATASMDKTIRLWDAATLKPLGEPLKDDGAVGLAAFSPDATKVASATSDNTVRIWDVTTRKLLGETLRHDSYVRDVTFSPDAAKIATASADCTARIWDAATGKPLGVPMKHDEKVDSVAFSPDGTQIATTSSDDKTVRLWDVATGKPIGDRLKHGDRLGGVAFSPDGTKFATASWDGKARLWDAAGGRLLGRRFRHDDEVNAVAFSPDGTKFATGSGNFGSKKSQARLWDAATGSPLGEPMRHDDAVYGVAFSPDGTKLATACCDKTARLWDLATDKPLGDPLKHEDMVWAVKFSPDGTKLATGCNNGTVRLWNMSTGKPLGKPLRHEGPVYAVAFSPDGTQLASASFDTTARLWDVATGNPLGRFKHDGPVWAVPFSPDGTKIATASDDCTARAWSLSTGKPLVELRHDSAVYAVAFSPDGTKLATASADKTARLWDAATGKPLGEPLRHDGLAHAVAFSPDGTKLATASYDKTARFWGVPRAIPDDSAWLAAYVRTVSQWREDADRSLHPLSREEADANWREVLKRPAWLDDRRTSLDESRHFLHVYEADRWEAGGDWFAAAFHLRWLCQREPKNVEWRQRLEKAKEHLAHRAPGKPR